MLTQQHELVRLILAYLVNGVTCLILLNSYYFGRGVAGIEPTMALLLGDKKPKELRLLVKQRNLYVFMP